MGFPCGSTEVSIKLMLSVGYPAAGSGKTSEALEALKLPGKKPLNLPRDRHCY